MRNRKDVDELSTTRAHAIAAAQRNGSTGELSDIEQETPTTTPEFVELSNLLQGAIELTTRTNSGQPAVIRVPHSILAMLVTVALAVIAGGYWLVSSVTEIKTNLSHVQENQREIRSVYSGNLRLMVAYTTNETNRIEFMKGLMSPAQQRQVFEWEKSNPKPPLPESDSEPDERNQ